MKTFLKSSVLSLVLLLSNYSHAAAADRDQLAEKYPDIEEGSLKPENAKILCPFHRMLERAGLYDSSKKEQSALTVGIIKIAIYAREFGCKFGGCAAVASLVSGGQLTQLTTSPGKVNLEALHTAFGVAHDCGLAFAKGGTTVSDEVRNRTLAALSARSDSMGRLGLEDLQVVKEAICTEQGVENTLAGKTEVNLIFSFLGGKDRGFIDYSDVERFFHAELPKTIGAPEAN